MMSPRHFDARNVIFWRFEEPAAAMQARSRGLASDVQSLQRQLEAKDAAMTEMQERIREQESVATSQKALIQQLEDDIFRSAARCSDCLALCHHNTAAQ